MPTKLARTAVCAALLLFAVGCAPTTIMMITSTPPGADVRANGMLIGQTPTAVNTDTLFPRRYMDFQLSSETAVTISKTGCQNEVVVVNEASMPRNLHVDLHPAPPAACN